MDTIQTRLKSFIQSHLGMTLTDFETKMGMSHGKLTKAINGDKKIGSDTMENIFSSYPELSIEWVFRGAGDMLLYKTMMVAEEQTHYVTRRELNEVLKKIDKLEQKKIKP